MKQNNFILLFITLIIISSSANSQGNFRKYYGGTMDDEARHITPTRDGNYIVSGMTLSYGSGNTDAYLLKTDASGNILWSKTYGDADDDYAEWVEPTSDHGLAICGYTFSQLNQDFRIYILKTDSAGTIEWQKQIKITNVARAYCIRETSDKGYIISAEEDSTGLDGNLLLVKLDSLGNFLWSSSFGIPLNADVGQYIEETHDHGFIVCGMSRFGLNSSFATLLKTDSIGNHQWSKTYYDQVTTHSKIYPNRIKELPDGSLIVSGSSFMVGSPLQGILLMKTDSAGDILWSELYSTGNGDGCTDLTFSENKAGYYMCGYSQDSLTGNRNALILKTDTQGVLLWNNLYGNDTLDGSFEGLAPSGPGGFILTGTANTYGLGLEDILLMNTDTAGVSQTCFLHHAAFTTTNFQLTDNGSLTSYPLTVVPINQNFSVAAGMQSMDVCQTTGIKQNPPLSSITISYLENEKSISISNVANEHISGIKITDVTGKVIFEKINSTTERTINIPMHGISKGVYVANVFSHTGILTKKFGIN